VAVQSNSVFGTPFEGFSLSHAAILSGTTGAEAATIYGCRNGSISTDQGNFENTGDDVVLSEHFWINFANITIEEGYIPFSTIAYITGTTVGSSGAAGADYYAIDLWTLNSMNQPTQPLAIRVPSKDAAGQIRTLDFVLYKVQFQPFNFTGPSYKTGLSCSIAGRALFSSINEVGYSFTDSQGMRLGRLVSWPGNISGQFVAEPFSGMAGTALAAGQSTGNAF
jgi:hypothetical protein